MRKYLLIVAGVALAAATFVATANSGFCEGYKDGYKEGWCYGEYSCLPPLLPLCPLPNLGENDYKDGYNRGLIEGQREKAER